MTYTIKHPVEGKVSFVREQSYSATILGISGGLIFAVGSLAIPFLVLKIIAVIGGIAFSIASIYLPSFNDRFVPDQVDFNLIDKKVTFTMSDNCSCTLPLSYIKDFQIEVEKRSPSAANSVGIHFLHHHVNLRRHNDALWTITTTTIENEAASIRQTLMDFLQKEEIKSMYVDFPTSKGMEVDEQEFTRIRWQESKYELLIQRNKIRYTEFKSNKVREKMLEFNTEDFKCVRYSYLGSVKNRNWTVFIVFGKETETHLNLFFRDLNPVQCLQLECWLHQTIQKKLSA